MAFRKSLAACLLLSAATLGIAAGPEPIVVPYEVLGQALAIRVKVGGQQRRIVLTTNSPYSYLKGASDASVDVEIGGRTLGRVRFREPNEGLAVSGEEGGIGMDVLKGMALGIDAYLRQVTIWPKGSRTPSEADAWVSSSPTPGGSPRVRRLKTGTLPTGSPSLDAAIDGKRVPVLIRLGFNGSILPPSVVSPSARVGKSFALVTGVSLSGLPPSWLLYRPGAEGTIDRSIFGVRAAVSLEAFESRRVLLDFAADGAYVEELGDDERRFKLLTRFTRVPMELREGEIFIRVPPNPDPASGLSALLPYDGCRVSSLADAPAKAWIEALRGKDEEGSKRLATLLGSLFQTFRIDIITPDGQELSITVPVP